MKTSETLTINQGDLIGNITDEGIFEFLGIPYAKPPKETPYQAPKSPDYFKGIFDARSYGATAPQAKTEPPLDTVFPANEIIGDNCLNLNIWTKSLTGKRPVMIFIHGGGFSSGSGSISGYNGRALNLG